VIARPRIARSVRPRERQGQLARELDPMKARAFDGHEAILGRDHALGGLVPAARAPLELSVDCDVEALNQPPSEQTIGLGRELGEAYLAELYAFALPPGAGSAVGIALSFTLGVRLVRRD